MKALLKCSAMCRLPRLVLLRIFPIAYILCVLVVVAVRAQQPSQNSGNAGSKLVFQTTTRAVVLDVVVTDSAGRPVHDLTKADFRIVEDGAPQEIASFEAANVHLHPLSETDRTQTVLILDEMNTRFEDLAFARYAMSKLLERNSGKLDMPTALVALTNSGLVQLHDYTMSGDELLKALEHHRAELPWRLQKGTEGEKERLATSIGAIQEIALSRADYHARKSIVWISPGFPILANLDLSADDHAVLFDAIRKLSDELLRTRTTMYTVDPRGVKAEPEGLSTLLVTSDSSMYLLRTSPGASTVADLTLERLAFETGGQALYGRNDLDQEIEDEIVNAATYFTLSYYPSNRNWDSDFRKIRVYVDKPELRATTRDGYFALPEPSPGSKEEEALQLTSAISSRLSFGAIPVRVDPTQLLPGATTVKVAINVGAQALSWSTSPNGDYHCKVEVVAANLTEKGQRLDYHLQSLGGTIPAQKFARSKSASWVIPLELSVKPEASRVRVVVRDVTSGKLGTADLLRP